MLIFLHRYLSRKNKYKESLRLNILQSRYDKNMIHIHVKSKLIWYIFHNLDIISIMVIN